MATRGRPKATPSSEPKEETVNPEVVPDPTGEETTEGQESQHSEDQQAQATTPTTEDEGNVNQASVDPKDLPHGASVSQTVEDTHITDTTGDAVEAVPSFPKAADQIDALGEFLTKEFPHEVTESRDESFVNIAIRLLQGLASKSDSSDFPRCPQQYCNRPLGHTDEHGIVNYSPKELA